MKKAILLILGIAYTLTSCTDDLTPPAAGDSKEVTFALTADAQPQMRSTGGATPALRYVMAIYDETGDNKVTAEMESADGSFSTRLDPGKYVCLCWSDYGSDNYDATDLKSVALQSSATNAEAFYARKEITVSDGGTVDITLNRAVAQIIMRETDNLETGKMTVSYTEAQNFNVNTETASNETSVTRTIDISSSISGTVSQPTNVYSFFMLANKDEKIISEFKVTHNDLERTITNVPIQANRKTYLNGEFKGYPYVTFSAESEQTFSMDYSSFSLGEGEYFEYSVGGGEWQRFTTTVSDIAFGGTSGDLRLRGKSSKGTAAATDSYSKIAFGTAGVKVDCKGDIRTLIDYENYRTASTADARFCYLFFDCTSLTKAPELPATTLADYCYLRMFSGCTSLTKAPELPATTLADYCYIEMFYNCTSLTKAPELNATTLGTGCYRYMFKNCSTHGCANASRYKIS